MTTYKVYFRYKGHLDSLHLDAPGVEWIRGLLFARFEGARIVKVLVARC